MQRLVALAGDLDVIDMGVVGDREALQRGVDLIVDGPSGPSWLSISMSARARLDDDERARIGSGSGLVAENMREMDRLFDCSRPCATWMTTPSLMNAVLSAISATSSVTFLLRRSLT